MDRFTKDGRWIIPLKKRRLNRDNKKEDNIRYVLDEIFCPNGCSLIDPENTIHEIPGIRIKYRRPGIEGEFVISAIEGDFEKIILSGELKDGVKDELFCPHCDTMLMKLVNCNCSKGAEMVMLGLTPKLDLNNAIAFCNVTGCSNGSFIKSGEVLRHLRLGTSFNRKKRE